MCQSEDDEDNDNDNDDDDDDRPRNRMTQTFEANHIVNENPIDSIAEQLFKLCISFLTQRFQQGEEPHSPLLHFVGVLAIDRTTRRFGTAYRYTPMLAGMIWVGRLLLLEYAIPKREYKTLQWPSRQYYDDHGWRLEDIRRQHMIEGSYSPISNLVGLLAYGKYVAKTEERAGLVVWDEDNMGLTIKDVHIYVTQFQSFMASIVKSVEDLIYKDLLFGLEVPKIDVNMLRDVMTKEDVGFSFLKEPVNRLEDGFEYMVRLVDSCTPDKRLLNGKGEWDRKRGFELLECEETDVGVVDVSIASNRRPASSRSRDRIHQISK